MTSQLPGRHTPLRPTWLCRIDAHPWPCGPAKLALLTEYANNRAELLNLLATMKVEAEQHLTSLDSGRQTDLTRRFLAWPPPPAAPSPR
ncbi:hypothetical protein [Micromonospora humida]|uniref:Flavin reductase n=1 Tax=Micromonospora humida TaxID=2809018 RepID=A0ABS2IR67_9ACTN|nr:hypothetical protein [Micromonospora humida]MBM7076509.1 hypothetical protein [Micromonospora humida]